MIFCFQNLSRSISPGPDGIIHASRYLAMNCTISALDANPEWELLIIFLVNVVCEYLWYEETSEVWGLRQNYLSEL